MVVMMCFRSNTLMQMLIKRIFGCCATYCDVVGVFSVLYIVCIFITTNHKNKIRMYD